LVSFSGQLPALLLTLFAGVWVDRWNRHRVLQVTQFLSMLESFALAVLAITNRINIWHIVGLTMFQGVVNAIDMPARQTFVVDMIEDRADLPNAIALNSSMVNSARLIGPSIAGLIIAVAGEGYCFLIDGFSYLAVLASLFLMSINSSQAASRRNVVEGLKEGWGYIRGFFPLRSILGMIAFVSLTGFPYSVLLPVFASTVLHGGPHTLGFLTGAAGVGALASALTLAMRRTVVGLGRLIKILVFTFGAALILFSFSRIVWLSLLLMIPLGFSMMGMLAASNTIMQTIVQEDKRGRVMSFYTLSFTGIMPLGSLIAGSLASRSGAPMTVAIGGSLCVACAVWFSTRLPEIRRIVRPIYVDLGILPEVARGIQAASALQTPPEISD
jgi:MFS family permease